MARGKRSNGEGTIYLSKAKGLWTAELVLPDGKKKRKRSKRQSVVREWLENEKQAVRVGTWVSGEPVKYGDFLERYLEEVAAHTLRPQTLISYTRQIRNRIIPALGHIHLTKLRPDHLQRFYSDILKTGISKTTVRYSHCVISRTLGIALKWGLVSRNVAEAVESPTPDPYDIKHLTVEEAKQFLKVLESDRLYAFYVVLITTGMRRGEALGLQKQDLDLTHGTVTIKRSLSFLPHKGLVLGETKSDKSNRTLALPEFTVQVLKDHLKTHSLNSNFLFATGNGTPFSPRNIHRHFKLKLDEAGLPQTIRMHDLRHSHISWLIRSGQDIKSVQAVAGHAQASTTLEIYAKLLPGYNRDVANKIEGMFKVSEQVSETR